MNIEAFHSKPLDQRVAIIKRKGTFLASCKRASCHSNLYYVPGFFAEVWYEPDRKEIFLIRGFTRLPELAPYLNLIDLKSIQPILE